MIMNMKMKMKMIIMKMKINMKMMMVKQQSKTIKKLNDYFNKIIDKKNHLKIK